MLIPIRIYVPFFTSLRIIHDEKSRSLVLKRQDQFSSELGLFLETLCPEIKSAEAQYVDPPNDVLYFLKQKSWLVDLKPLCNFIEIVADVDVDVDQLKELNQTSALDQAYINECALDEVWVGLNAALVLSELAFPGCIHTFDSALVSETHTTTLNAKRAFYELLSQEDQPHWPELKNLSLIQTLEWAQKIGFGAQAFASSRIPKALASLTHVVGRGPHNDSEALFRAVQGLEAFYCDGVGDLRRQMSEKSAIWLGRWDDNRNIVGQLYDVRSKFVHGSAPIGYWRYDEDASWRGSEKVEGEHAYATVFAIRLLIASLQKCVSDSTTELKWTFTADTNS